MRTRVTIFETGPKVMRIRRRISSNRLFSSCGDTAITFPSVAHGRRLHRHFYATVRVSSRVPSDLDVLAPVVCSSSAFVGCRTVDGSVVHTFLSL